MLRLLILCLLSVGCAQTVKIMERISPPIEDHCFLSEFTQEKFPWLEGSCLNYEEVFKNYEYFETIFDKKSQSLVVKRVIKGALSREDKYQVIDTKSNQWILRPL